MSGNANQRIKQALAKATEAYKRNQEAAKQAAAKIHAEREQQRAKQTTSGG